MGHEGPEGNFFNLFFKNRDFIVLKNRRSYLADKHPGLTFAVLRRNRKIPVKY